MAKIDFNAIKDSTNAAGTTNRVPFFGLKNDKDTAIVRIMHDSPESFDLLTVHQIQIDGHYRKVNCIREANDPVDACPFCAVKHPLSQKLYIHLLVYTRDDTGRIIPQPMVWERSASYARTLLSYINNYGPLSDCIFKIQRNGAAGNVNTTYDIMYCNPNVYTNDMYPKISDAFAEYNPIGNAVMNKSREEMLYFNQNAAFPQATRKQENAVNQTYTPAERSYVAPAAAPATQPVETPQTNYRPVTTEFNEADVPQPRRYVPTSQPTNTDNSFTRPQRYTN